MPDQTDQRIVDLPTKTASQMAATDKLLGIDAAEGYQMLIQDLGNYIIQNATSSLAGSTQTLANAIRIGYALQGGSKIAQNTNFNSIITPGNYYVDSLADAATMTNIPREMAGTLKVEVTNGSNVNYLRQIFSIYNSGEVEYRRGSTNKGSTWTEWVLVPTRTEVDTLNGKLMANNAVLASGTDFNNLQTSGIYNYPASSTNAPTTGSGSVIVMSNNSGTQCTQIATPANTDDTYIRYRYTSVWGEWKIIPKRTEIDALNSKTANTSWGTTLSVTTTSTPHGILLIANFFYVQVWMPSTSDINIFVMSQSTSYVKTGQNSVSFGSTSTATDYQLTRTGTKSFTVTAPGNNTMTWIGY